MSKQPPTYDLTEIQRMVREGPYIITLEARDGAAELEMDEEDIKACVLALAATDFHKTMPALKVRGLFQDVYRPTYLGTRLYVKLQLSRRGDAVVIQFKRK